MQTTYCHHIGAEFMFIRKPHILKWLSQKMEITKNTPNFNKEDKLRMLKKLNDAVVFENFMHTRFVGQKRFSLEGVETCIPALETIVEYGADLGIEEFIIGMAHRGRLNVLANILEKDYRLIFSEFEGKGYGNADSFSGDVKYHMGYSTDRITFNGKKVHISMPPNPSHLEAIAPVVQGLARAKIDMKYAHSMDKVLPIIIHGDASVSGQGIVYEIAQMSNLDGYGAGGTIHMVLNNQIGFTTSYKDGRSSTYCTDIAKITKSPVFHVNGDDVEALIYTIKLALEYHKKFRSDVYIDILGYRKHGHNEGDDPRFTQPKLYKLITQHKNPREIYVEKLIKEGTVDSAYGKNVEKEFRGFLDEELIAARKMKNAPLNSFFAGQWQGMRLPEKGEIYQSPSTGVTKKILETIADKVTFLSKDYQFYSKIIKIYDERRKLFFENKKIDWALGEALSFGTLLHEGFNVRLSGQDVRRGTFSQRHSVVLTEHPIEDIYYTPLANISNEQGSIDICNSFLSEYGVLGFEFGYSMAMPKTLTLWEAQFGDFGNGAQIIIDQFITSAETKWQRMNGLVLLLPHGYEGQGPEHSSAHPERYLAACAEKNISVCNCTTPANYFHLLRRQLHRSFRKPLIVFTPKSLLRHPKCVSDISELQKDTRFQPILDDTSVTATKVKKIIFCSGKIYYDLDDYRIKNKRDDVAIVRLEQLYPFHKQEIAEIIGSYKKTKEILWVQEEVLNMGPANFIKLRFPAEIKVISRPSSSTTATGFIKQHLKEQNEIIEKSFA